MNEISDSEKTQLLLGECMNTSIRLAGKPCTERMHYSTGVFTFQVLVAHTIWCTVNPRSRDEFAAVGNKVIQDFASCFILLRAMYEACVRSRYLLLNDALSEVKNVILEVAALHALRERYTLGASMRSSHPEFDQIVTDLQLRKDAICGHAEFPSLSQSIQNWVHSDHDVNKDWDNTGFEKMAEIAGFHKTQHYQMNKYFSNYVHCNPLAVEQINAVRSPIDLATMSEIVAMHLQNLLSQAYKTIVDVYDSEGDKLHISELATEIIDPWEDINGHDLSDHLL